MFLRMNDGNRQSVNNFSPLRPVRGICDKTGSPKGGDPYCRRVHTPMVKTPVWKTAHDLNPRRKGGMKPWPLA